MTKEELKKEFEKYLKDSADYYDPREPLTERKLLQMWLDCAEPREKRIEQLQRINNEQKEILKKVRVALIQERTANIMNYGKGGVEMFDSMFEILKGVSN